jgi:hypothetical protein
VQARRVKENAVKTSNAMKALNMIVSQLSKDEITALKRHELVKGLESVTKTLVIGLVAGNQRLKALESAVPALRSDINKNDNATKAIVEHVQEEEIDIKSGSFLLIS